MSIPGGFSSQRQVGVEQEEILNSLRNEIETSANQNFTTFKALSYATQVVAGTNYHFIVETDDGKVLNIKIHRPLPHTNRGPQLISVEEAFDQ